jgi:phage baseplate assembly protein W
MATETLQVSTVSAPNDWALGAGVSKVAAVQLPDDDDSSYIEQDFGDGLKQQYTLSDTSAVGASDTINSVTIRARVKTLVGGVNNIIIGGYLSGSVSESSVLSTTGTWSDHSYQMLSKPGGGAWAKADVDVLEVFTKLYDPFDGENWVRVTTLYVVVDYTSSGTTKSDSDAGSGADASALAASVVSSDVAAGGEAGTLAASVISTDAGAGSDLVGTLTASVSDIDAAAGNEGAVVFLFSADFGAGEESQVFVQTASAADELFYSPGEYYNAAETGWRAPSRTFYGSCLSFPIRTDLRGTLATEREPEKIVEQSIMSIIGTRQGERVMLPNYGIPDFVFSVMDGGFAVRLAFFIEQQLLRYEPLVESVKARAGSLREGAFVSDPAVADAQRAVVSVEYTLRGSTVPRNLIFPTWELLPAAA